MDLKQLQYFVVCAQTGSFSDAAKVLYSTQPSVSKVVKALEDALGMQLFESASVEEYASQCRDRKFISMQAESQTRSAFWRIWRRTE